MLCNSNKMISSNKFKCLVCGYESNRKYNLKVHTDNKSACEKRLRKNADKKVNPNDKKVNPGDKKVNPEVNPGDKKVNPDNKIQNSCKNCNQIFSHKSYLMKHEKNCSGLSSLQCPTCKKTFASKQSKYKHEKKCKYNTNVNYISKEEHLEELQKLEKEITDKLTAQFTKMLNEKNIGNTNNNTMKIGDHNTDITTQNNFTIIRGKFWTK